MRGKVMAVRTRNLTVPEIMLIGGTRVVHFNSDRNGCACESPHY